MMGLQTGLSMVFRNVIMFSHAMSGIRLREYQIGPARAIVESVRDRAGRSFVIIFPRQSGKNELQAQIEAYLMFILKDQDTEIVKASPTWKPQSINAMRRLERVLERNTIFKFVKWDKESGYIFKVENARIYFLSGSDTANVVGATANVLLECDEAQDVGINKWDKDFAPMAASTNATRVFWGTAWTSKTLLARERREAEKNQKKDGIQRVWIMDAEDVANEVPEYGDYVTTQIAKLGRNHPMVKTQFFSEEIDAEGGMFPPERLEKMRGDHPPLSGPEPGQSYAMAIDVAGEDEGAVGEEIDAESLSLLENPARDATAVTIFNLDLSTLPPDSLGAATYRVVARYTWVGTKHTQIFMQLKEIAKQWRVEYIVIDSTGVGAGLASLMEASFPGRVIPFLFTSKSKSDLGWQFLAVIETGRYKEPIGLKTKFWEEAKCCMNQVLEGPGRMMRWGVPDGTRNEFGELVHDDELISSALCAVLDEQELGITSPPVVVVRGDPLEEMDGEGF
jgi:hypothetical protein